jgi:O-acetyl-ADP-ribose deacetylase (regulator of RNase III)
MNLEIFAGNLLDVPADVMISTANPWLQMTGGVNLAIILRPQGELVYEELQRYLRGTGKDFVEPGTIVCTGPASLPVKKILHAVSLDRSYETSVELVAETIVRALTRARELGAKTVSIPALATGFGPLSMEEFATALGRAVERDWTPLNTLKVVLKHQEEAEKVQGALEKFGT